MNENRFAVRQRALESAIFDASTMLELAVAKDVSQIDNLLSRWLDELIAVFPILGIDVPMPDDFGNEDDKSVAIGPYERVRQGLDTAVFGFDDDRYPEVPPVVYLRAFPEIIIQHSSQEVVANAISTFYGDADFARDVIRKCFCSSDDTGYTGSALDSAFKFVMPARLSGASEWYRLLMAEKVITAAGLRP